MAQRNTILPGARVPLVNLKTGLIDPTWLRFFTDLYERTGGGAVDKVDSADATATTAGVDATQAVADAAAAQATANSALGGGVDIIDEIREFRFLGDFGDLR